MTCQPCSAEERCSLCTVYKGTLTARNTTPRLLHPPIKYTRTLVFFLSPYSCTNANHIFTQKAHEFPRANFAPAKQSIHKYISPKTAAIKKKANKKERAVHVMQSYMGHCLKFVDMPAKLFRLNSNQQSNHHRMESSSLVPELKLLLCKAAKRLLPGLPRMWNCSLTSMNITLHFDRTR